MTQVHVDENVVAELQDVMGEDFHVLLETFMDDSLNRVLALQEALQQAAAEELRQVAHSFKGSSGNIGAPHLYTLCQELEALGRSGSVDGADVLVEQLRQELEEVERIMRGYLI
ncbi:MAG: Hpt domain-containing protein [Gammaproteobacteria bacterium]